MYVCICTYFYVCVRVLYLFFYLFVDSSICLFLVSHICLFLNEVSLDGNNAKWLFMSGTYILHRCFQI